METPKTTIYQVARHADVSTATVSRVLNNSTKVTDKTKQKILAVMDKLNYTPHLAARKLASNKPHILAIIVPSFTTPYFNEVLKGIKDKLRRLDLDIILYNTGSRNRGQGIQRFFDRGMSDAVVILSINIEEKVHQRLHSMHMPIVLVGTNHPDYNYFEANDFKGGYMAGEHLVQQGFKEIGMITTYRDQDSSGDRKEGFLKALEDHDIAINQDYFIQGDSKKHSGYTEESGFEAIQKFKEKGGFPEAIFCMSDTQAIGAMHALSKLGMRVPEDIAIMGYDNIKMSKYLDLTTMDQKMYSIGAKVIERLESLFDDPEQTPERTVINPILIERGSTVNKQ